jgi:HEAT repeat protein
MRALPSVMVDVGAEHRELIQHVIEGGSRGQEAFDEIVRSGEQVIQAVMARFPGPLRVDRHRARGELPAASQCGPILELVVAIRRPALPFVSVRSSASDPEVRFWATHTLGELRYPEAATVLVPRLFDDDAQVRRIARRSAAALVGSGAAGAPILKGLEDITRNPDQPKLHRMVAIETMGEIRSGSLVPPLLDALDDASEDVADAARRALLLIARQDFGKDLLRWHDWWAKNGGRHRIEWLIDALMHEVPSVRRAAGDELKLLTKEYFGYYDDLPKRDRERAQALYRAWWDREGRRRFA